MRLNEDVYVLCDGRFEVRRQEYVDPFTTRFEIKQMLVPRHMIFDIRNADTGVRNFVKVLLEEQQKLMEAEFESVKLALANYERNTGSASSYRTIDAATAYYCYRINPGKANPITLELPKVDYTYKRKGTKFLPEPKIDLTSSVMPNLPDLKDDLLRVSECVESIVDALVKGRPIPLPSYSPGSEFRNDPSPSKGLMQVIPSKWGGYDVVGGVADEAVDKPSVYEAIKSGMITLPEYDQFVRDFELPEEMLKNLGLPQPSKSQQAKNSKNPAYWAHSAEDKINGVLQQAIQNLGEEHETTVVLKAISDCLSDHIAHLGGE